MSILARSWNSDSALYFLISIILVKNILLIK
jgi:hypothetical protein